MSERGTGSGRAITQGPAGIGLQIVDPHMHLVDLSTGFYPRFADHRPGDPFADSYLLDDFRADAAEIPNLVGAVHVEAFPEDPVGETRTVASIIATSDIPFAIVGHADLESDDFEAQIDAQLEEGAFRGVRQAMNTDLSQAAGELLDHPRVPASLRRLGDLGLSFDLQVLGHQLRNAARVVSQCDKTSIIVNHAALWTDRTLSGWQTWKSGIREIAELPNTVIKISGLGMRDPHWTVQSLRPLIFEVLDAFGTDRAMFASNFPVDKCTSSYGQLWQAFDDFTADLTETERERLFSGTARQIYRI